MQKLTKFTFPPLLLCVIYIRTMSPCTKKVIITIFTQSLKVLIWSFWENAVVVRMIRSTGTDPFLSPNKKHGQRIIIPQTYFCQQVKTNHQHHQWTQSWKWKPHAWYLVGCTTTLTLMTQLHRILTQVFLSRSWKNIKQVGLYDHVPHWALPHPHCGVSSSSWISSFSHCHPCLSSSFLFSL